ncbi:protein piccolo-like [Ischnura elegans]|uniref:protein piccolo-like n=1 Tax=Ischnura elegans TaxID=197161 RepID=UPI001ED87201|nr:protein piccolo-like [Ischnura elegans]XP_046402374.1 protein piccolo-like [Ischnura elegans]
MNIVERSVICGYGWQTDWRDSCGAVRDVIRGPFNCPRVVDSIPYAVLHCLCESRKAKCCGCGTKCRQYSFSPCAQPCIPTGCSVDYPFVGYRAVNIGMGIPDPWLEKIFCCPATEKDKDKSANEDETENQDLDPASAGACVQNICVSPAQGIPDPWLCWPKACATVAAMARKPCPIHRPRPTRQPPVQKVSPRRGVCSSLKKFLHCRRGRSRSRRPRRRKWFSCRHSRCRHKRRRNERCCCCCCCCCCEHGNHGGRRCCGHQEDGDGSSGSHPLNQLSSYHGDNGNGNAYPAIEPSEPDRVKYQRSGKNGAEDVSKGKLKSPSAGNKQQKKPKTKSQGENWSEAQAKSQPKPKPKSQPQWELESPVKTVPKSIESKSKTRPQPQSELMAQSKSHPGPQPLSELESQQESKPKSQPQLRSAPRSQPRSTPRSQPKSTLRSQPRCTPRSTPRSQPESDQDSQPKPIPKSQTQSKPKSQTISDRDSQPRSKPKSHTNLQPRSQPKSETQLKLNSQYQPQPRNKSPSKPQPEPIPEPEPQPQLEHQSRSQPQPKILSKPQARPRRPSYRSQDKSLPIIVDKPENSTQSTRPSELFSVSPSLKQTAEVSVQYDGFVGESRSGEQQPYGSSKFAESRSNKMRGMREARGTQTDILEARGTPTDNREENYETSSKNQSIVKKERCARSMQTQTSGYKKENAMIAKNAGPSKKNHWETSGVVQPGTVMVLANDSLVGPEESSKEKNAQGEISNIQPPDIKFQDPKSNTPVDRSCSERESSVKMRDSASDKTYPCIRKKTYPCVAMIEEQKPKHSLIDPCFVCACKQSRAKTLLSSSPSSTASSSKYCGRRKMLTKTAVNEVEPECNPRYFSRSKGSHLKNGNKPCSSGKRRRTKTVELFPNVYGEVSFEESESDECHDFPVLAAFPNNDGDSRLSREKESTLDHFKCQCKSKNPCARSLKGLRCFCEAWPKKPLPMNDEGCSVPENMVATVSRSNNVRKDDCGLMVTTPKSDYGHRIRAARDRDVKRM